MYQFQCNIYEGGIYFEWDKTTEKTADILLRDSVCPVDTVQFAYYAVCGKTSDRRGKLQHVYSENGR